MELLSIRWHDVDGQRQVMTLRSQGIPGTFFALHQRTDTDSTDQPGASTYLVLRTAHTAPVWRGGMRCFATRCGGKKWLHIAAELY